MMHRSVSQSAKRGAEGVSESQQVRVNLHNSERDLPAPAVIEVKSLGAKKQKQGTVVISYLCTPTVNSTILYSQIYVA